MKKIYFGENRKGTWKASFDKEKIIKFDNFTCIKFSEPIHLNKLYMIRKYYGFDYDYSAGGIISRYEYSTLFHSIMAAKKSKSWIEVEKLAKERPKDYIVQDRMIATDCGGEPFIYGDVMEGKINAEIIVVPLI